VSLSTGDGCSKLEAAPDPAKRQTQEQQPHTSLPIDGGSAGTDEDGGGIGG